MKLLAYRLFAMIHPTAEASAIPVITSIVTARLWLRFFNSQPVNAPVPAAGGTVTTLQNTPAIGQMFDFIANGTRKHVSPTQEQ